MTHRYTKYPTNITASAYNDFNIDDIVNKFNAQANALSSVEDAAADYDERFDEIVFWIEFTDGRVIDTWAEPVSSLPRTTDSAVEYLISRLNDIKDF